MSFQTDEERKAAFAKMNQVDIGIMSSQIPVSPTIPLLNEKDEDHLNKYADSQFEKFEKNEVKAVKDKNLSGSAKIKKIQEIESKESAVEELSKTVRIIQSPNTSGHEKFSTVDKFLKNKKYSDSLPDSLRDTLEKQRDILKKSGFSEKSSTSTAKEEQETKMEHDHQIEMEVRISDG